MPCKKKQGLGRAAIKAREAAREAPLSWKQTDAASPSAVLFNRVPPEAVAILHWASESDGIPFSGDNGIKKKKKESNFFPFFFEFV